MAGVEGKAVKDNEENTRKSADVLQRVHDRLTEVRDRNPAVVLG